MSTPEEVLRQVIATQDGSRVERAGAGLGALDAFVRLPPADKRALAVLIAQRAAPDLVPRIQAETGMDLTAEQSRAVLDMVRRLDADDLAELQAAVSSPEARREAMGAVGAAAATATGLDDVVATGTRDPAAGESDERLRARVRVLDERVDELTEELAEARQSLAQAENEARTARGEVQDAASRAEAAERAAQDHHDVAERARRDARRVAEQLREVEERLRRREARTVAGTVGSSRVGATVAADDGDPGDAAALVARLREASSSSALRILSHDAATMAALSPPQRRQVVLAVPDGWARRRAVQRLVEAGSVTPQEAPALLATLSSAGNQVFAARSLMDAGVADLADLAPVLDPGARGRLERALPAA